MVVGRDGGGRVGVGRGVCGRVGGGGVRVVGWGWWGGCDGVEWVVVGCRGVVGGVIRLSSYSNSNSQKLSLWCKRKSLPT